jgi:hypothetical protein
MHPNSHNYKIFSSVDEYRLLSQSYTMSINLRCQLMELAIFQLDFCQKVFFIAISCTIQCPTFDDCAINTTGTFFLDENSICSLPLSNCFEE